MSEDNRHILQAAEEKLESLSAEIGRLHNELDRYSKALVKSERERDRLSHEMLEICGTSEPKSMEIAQRALRKEADKQ